MYQKNRSSEVERDNSSVGNEMKWEKTEIFRFAYFIENISNSGFSDTLIFQGIFKFVFFILCELIIMHNPYF